MDENRARDAIARLGRSLFDRGLTHGASGNITVRLNNGCMLSTPTNVSLGHLEPAMMSKLDTEGKLINGPQPTKEIPLHAAFYASRASTGAVVHLHSTHSTAASILADIDPNDIFPPLTAYYLMRVGRTALVPYHRPGDPAVEAAIKGLAGRYSAVLLANHGPVVAGENLEQAMWAIEELEATAKLFLLLKDHPVRLIDAIEAEAIRKKTD